MQSHKWEIHESVIVFARSAIKGLIFQTRSLLIGDVRKWLHVSSQCEVYSHFLCDAERKNKLE